MAEAAAAAGQEVAADCSKSWLNGRWPGDERQAAAEAPAVVDDSEAAAAVAAAGGLHSDRHIQSSPRRRTLYMP